jgi:hypothetical protein
MVRSKGEPGKDYRHLIEQIRAEQKYFNYSRLEVAARVNAERVADIECEHPTMSESGPVDVPLRLVVARRRKYWSVALMLHGMRVDGIDWLPSYPCEDGTTGSGWHRHQWDDADENADVHVALSPNFGDGINYVEDFLIRISQEMRIAWSANDVGFESRLPLPA